MILVFFILIIIIGFGLFFSKISLDICEFKLNNNYNKLNTKFLIKVKTYMYFFIPITIFKLNNNYISIFGIKLSYTKILDNSKIKKLLSTGLNIAKKDFKISSIKLLKPDLESINLNLNFGTESFFVTTILVFMLSTLLSFGIQNTIKKFDSKKYKYIIKPDYEEKNKIILELKGIFKIKTAKIIECVKVNNL